MAGKRKRATAAGRWVEYHLRRLCGAIAPEKRVVVTLTLFFLFAGLSLYITVSSVYRFGRGKGERLNIRHIEQLPLELKGRQHVPDSVKQPNKLYYEYDRKKE